MGSTEETNVRRTPVTTAAIRIIVMELEMAAFAAAPASVRAMAGSWNEGALSGELRKGVPEDLPRERF